MTILLSALSYGETSRLARVPELARLQDVKVAIYGVGAIGGFMAIEFARIGIKLLRLVDHDTADPAGACRWPIGVSVAGKPKVLALNEYISTNYPLTTVDGIPQGIGRVELRPPAELERDRPNEWDQMMQWNRGLDLVIDATAEFGVQQCLTYQLADLNIPLISVSATRGGWGGAVVRGCVLCYEMAIDDDSMPKPPQSPNLEAVQPAGCADRTFSAAGFDTEEVALIAVRYAVATLCKGMKDAYPDYDGDALTIRIRDEQGRLVGPVVETHTIPVHPACPLHGTHQSA